MLCEATNVPVTADLGFGYGEAPEDVGECVALAAAAGLAGCSIEDASVLDGKVIAFDKAVDRIAAAVAVARALDHDFLITARCENFAFGGTNLDDTLRRLQAYEQAGADVLYAPGMTSLDQIELVCRSVTRPVNVLTGFNGMNATFEQLERVGVKRVSVGVQLARISYAALVNAAEELHRAAVVETNDIPLRSAKLAGFFR